MKRHEFYAFFITMIILFSASVSFAVQYQKQSGQWETIQTITTSGSQTNVTFSSISTDYVQLQIVAQGLYADATNTNRIIAIQFNGDTGTHYNNSQMRNDNGTFTGADNFVGASYIRCDYFGTNKYAYTTNMIININNFALLRAFGNSYINTFRIAGGNCNSSFQQFQFDTTAKITSIKLYDPSTTDAFVDGSIFILRGIK